MACGDLLTGDVWCVEAKAYGWLPPLDNGKYGFGRGNLYHRDAMASLACLETRILQKKTMLIDE